MKHGPSSTPAPTGVAPGNLPVSALRCAAVWTAITVLAAVGTALGAESVADCLRTSVAPTSVDQALVVGAGIGAVALCPWLWFLATLSVFEALRGRTSGRPGWTRRITLLACGVAVSTSVVASPVQAADGPREPVTGTETVSLSGLPYPDRVTSRPRVTDEKLTPPPVSVSTETPGRRTKRPRATTTTTGPSTGTAASLESAREDTYRVRAGDTLWAIAAATPGTDVPTTVTELYRRNRRVIGDNPNLIRPGQVLDLHSEGDESR